MSVTQVRNEMAKRDNEKKVAKELMEEENDKSEKTNSTVS